VDFAPFCGFIKFGLWILRAAGVKNDPDAVTVRIIRMIWARASYMTKCGLARDFNQDPSSESN
jgi:hypothetical protein